MPDRSAFSHVLFDLDHTLAFYPLSTAGVVRAVLGRLGLPFSSFASVDDLASRYDSLWVALERGARTADELRLAVWRRLLAERGLSADGLAETIAQEYGIMRRASGVQLFDGVRDLLMELRAAKYGLGLLTNGLSDAQWEKIRFLKIESAFDAVAVAGDVGLYKPDPRAFVALLGRLRTTPERALFVGDSYETDIIGADAAGIASAWIRADGTPRPGAVAPTYEFSSVLGVREVTL